MKERKAIRKSFVFGMVLALVATIFAAMPMNVSADPGTIIVPDDYTTIQAAIDAANPGDTVYVKAGTYYEHVIINKALTLQGEDRDSTIIDGGGTGDVVYISADWTILEGLTATNAGMGTGSSGVKIDNADHCSVEDVKASDNNDLGINLRYADYCVINHNYVANNFLGILSYWSTNNEFGFNYIYNNPANGLQTATGWQGGVHTESDSWIHNNIVIGNGIGVTWVTAGIFLWGSGSKNNIIENNLCDGNKDGIHFRASGITGNIIRGNTIENSVSSGIRYTIGAGPNTFYNNNFVNNGVHLSGTSWSDTWDNGYPIGGNYWDTYSGMDDYSGAGQDIPGSDGIGDSTYVVTGGGVDHYPLMSPVSVGQNAVEAIGGVVDDLGALIPTGNDKIDKKLDKAIEHLQKSLNIDPENPDEAWKDKDLWLDDDTLDPKEGKHVLSEWGKAAKDMNKLIKDNDKGKLVVPESILQLCQDNIDMLVEMAEQFATDAYEEAEAIGGDEPWENELEKCDKEFEKAQDDLDHLDKDGNPDPKYDKAIDHFKKAWEHAQKALKHAGVGEEPEEEGT